MALAQEPSRDAVDAALVLVDQLVADPDQIGDLFLRQTAHDAAFTNADRDNLID
jgi:hypothetical protein